MTVGMTNEELLDRVRNGSQSVRWDAADELRRRLQAGEEAERERDRLARELSLWTAACVAKDEWAGEAERARSAAQMEVVDLIRQRDDARSDAVIAEAERDRLAEQVEKLTRQRNRLAGRIFGQRRRLRELDAIVANHAEHYRVPIERAAEAARSHLVAWQEQYFRAEAAEREVARLREENERLRGVIDSYETERCVRLASAQSIAVATTPAALNGGEQDA